MKRFLFGFLAVLFLILNTLPFLHIMADDMPTNSQYEMLGAYALSTLITSGEATELDFSDYTENDTSFLIDLGEAIFTGDWSGLAEDGLEWLGDTADNIYDSYKEYVSQWKYDHLGIMYSNWFPDEQIRVGPDDSYSLAKPLRDLFTPRNNDSPPTPVPHPDFSYLDNIAYLYVRNMEFVQNMSVPWAYNNGSGQVATWGFQRNLVTYFSPSTYLRHTYIDNNYMYYGSLGIYNGILTVNFNTETLQAEYYGAVPFSGVLFTSVNGNNTGNSIQNVSKNYGTYNGVMMEYMSVNGSATNSWIPRTDFSGAGLSTFCNYIYNQFANINIYVDDQPWVIVNNSQPTYPIVIPGQLTIYNNQPLQYSFPADTHIDLPDLTNIIRNAINSSGVVMWSDIADVFVDVNGQTAVAVTKIVRNDYDNLYMEQYPYPAMLIGMSDQTKFNEHLLDNSHAYLEPMGTIVQETVNVLPSELVGVLAIGAILTIFAVIINRLLE